MSEDIEKSKRVNIYNVLEKEFGFKARVFSIQLLRPFYGFDVEKRYKNGLEPFNDAIYDAKKRKVDVSEIVKERSEYIKEFFAAEKIKNPGMFTIEDMYFSFQHFSNLIASLYNKVCSRMFTDIMAGNKKGSPYTMINEIFTTPFNISKKIYNLNDLVQGNGFSDVVSGLDRKIRSNFSGKYIKDFIIGKKSIPNASSNFPIPIYKHVSHGSLVSFQGVDYEREEFITGEGNFGDYIVTLRVPVVHPSEKKKPRKSKKKKDDIEPVQDVDDKDNEKINFMDEISSVEFKDIPFIIHSGFLLRKSRDGSTNVLIQDFLTGRIENRIRRFVEDNETEISECIKSKNFKKNGELADIEDVINEGVKKWSGISSYEILARKTKFSAKDNWFVNFSYQALPRNITSRSEARVAGVDFCFSKRKILSVVVIDKDVYNSDKEKIQSFVVDEMPIFDSVYHLRRLYDKWRAGLGNLQRAGKKSPKSVKSLSKIQITFENKRKYFINKITKDIAVMCEERNVLEVHAENLDNLRERNDWFTINKIRAFPTKGMITLLERKLNDRGIKLIWVNPRNTSRTCPICGTVNDDFTFEYRSKNGFPIFTCKNSSCRYSKPSDKIGLMEKHYRDADLNASVNIALKEDSKPE